MNNWEVFGRFVLVGVVLWILAQFVGIVEGNPNNISTVGQIWAGAFFGACAMLVIIGVLFIEKD